GDHSSPILYVFVPLGWLAPGASALLLAQTLIFAAGAVPMAAFAARRLGDARLGAGFALLYLSSPTLHGINVRDIHPAAFAIPLLITAAWAVDAGRPAWAAVAVVAALAGREDAAIAGVGFGVWLALARRRWAVGAAAAALPGLAVNLLSTDAFLFHHRTPYQAFVLPFLMLAAVEGFATLREAAWWPRRIPRVAPLVAAGVVAVVLASRTVNELGVSKWALGPEQRAAHALMTRVPPLIPVSVNERLVPHLATRAECYIFPAGVDRAQWVLDRESSITREKVGGFEVVARERGWTLLRRQS